MVHFIWPVMTERLYFTSSDQSRYTLWSCHNVCDTLSYLLDNINHDNQADVIERVQVGKDKEKAQSEKDSHSKNRGGKKPN